MEEFLIWLNAERGRGAQVALRLEITHGALSQWKQVPADKVLAIEAFTGISRHVLRPDLSAIFIEAEPPLSRSHDPANPSPSVGV